MSDEKNKKKAPRHGRQSSGGARRHRCGAVDEPRFHQSPGRRSCLFRCPRRRCPFKGESEKTPALRFSLVAAISRTNRRMTSPPSYSARLRASVP